jgi:adenylyltransferase/sulfurtransferase
MSAPVVAVIGAGGLGGPIAIALADAGVRVRVIDFDRVELSNLQRQVQFTTADVGASKAERLAARVRGEAIDARFEPAHADGCDAVVDGTDSPETKFAAADAARARGLPYVIAGALRYGGNVFSGDPRAPGSACYRCLFEDPSDGDGPTCADAGILGPVCACLGGLAARALLRLIDGDTRDAGTILVVDDLRRGFAPRRVSFRPRAGCACAARASIPKGPPRPLSGGEAAGFTPPRVPRAGH